MSKHCNTFIDLNGVPYLLAEYSDRNSLQQVDRSTIKSGIYIDQSDAMRAVIDINVDDIGKRTDGLPSIVGNITKQKKLLEMVKNYAEQFDHHFKVLKRGIVMRVNYQLENSVTGQTIRSMSEDIRIPDRYYFLDINPRNIDDNAVIINFSDTAVSSVTEFTHGRDRMSLRITNIQMFYECLKDTPIIPRIKDSLTSGGLNSRPQYDNDMDYYRYHEHMQNHHVIGTPGCDHRCDDVIGESLPSWPMFNRFYHFEKDAKDIILHSQEICDPLVETVRIPCGTITVNRLFSVNPGHRLIFKFSIWKNDLTIVNDTSNLARALKAPYYDYNWGGCNHHDNKHDDCHHIDPNYDQLLREIHDLRRNNNRQNQLIGDLVQVVKELQYIVNNYGKNDPPSEPVEPEPPIGEPDTDKCNCDHSDINEKIDQLISELRDMKTGCSCDCGDLVLLSPEEIEDIVNNVKSNRKGE